MRGDEAGSRVPADSIAADIGSGLSTMPGPPPYGLSSTVRCTSRVNSRGSTQPTRTSPRSTARPNTPNLTACWISSGNRVTTSICMSRASETRGPIHRQPPRVRVHAAQVLRAHRNPVLTLTLDHHHRITRRVDEMIEHTQQHAIDILHFEPDQVRAEMLAPRGRAQLV